MRTRTKVLIAVPVLAVAVGVGGPFLYINVIQDDPPPKLTVSDTLSGAPVDASALEVAGEWTVGAGSQAGYRVKEVLAGQSTEAVGRTDKVTGGFTVAGSTISKAAFTVDLTSVTTDSDRRDNQFRGRIMDVEQFPDAVFTLTGPVTLPSVPADQATVEVPVKGTLAMHGATQPVDVTLTAKRNGQSLEVAGQIPVEFADYGIDNPSFGPAKVGDDGTVEVLLKLVKG